jgi:hypothetical protein
MLIDRRRLLHELERLESRIAVKSSAHASLLANERQQLFTRLCQQPNQASTDGLTQDINLLTAQLTRAARAWVAVGSP